MKQPEDDRTFELVLKNPVGRPRKAVTKSPAQRAYEYRQRVWGGQRVLKRDGN